MQNNNVNTLDFNSAFESQPFWLQKKLRKDIMFRCGWKSRTTFQNKVSGETQVKLPEIAVIRSIFSEHGIDVNFNTTKIIENAY